MILPDIKIAIDGHSSTGKSSFAKLVAKKFELLYLDSGALYRGVTLFAMENNFIGKNISIENTKSELEQALKGLELSFKKVEGGSATFMFERCIEKEIRTLEVSNFVSPIATLPFVRDFVNEVLRKESKNRSVVMDGRDIGTTVFPNADIKIFMTAAPEIRAERRMKELESKGDTQSFEDVLKNINERDFIDSHRETSPLKKAEDAFVLDNSQMNMNEELAWVEGLIQGKMGIRDFKH